MICIGVNASVSFRGAEVLHSYLVTAKAIHDVPLTVSAYLNVRCALVLAGGCDAVAVRRR